MQIICLSQDLGIPTMLDVETIMNGTSFLDEWMVNFLVATCGILLMCIVNRLSSTLSRSPTCVCSFPLFFLYFFLSLHFVECEVRWIFFWDILNTWHHIKQLAQSGMFADLKAKKLKRIFS